MKSDKIILVTNDDGISAKGILFLSKLASEFGEVWVVAPDRPRSGSGHAITLCDPLRTERTHFHQIENEYTCSGTPADCVKLAVNKYLPRKPDLLLSGVNHGHNLSINVLYSGTMSAVLEGALSKIPSIGFSFFDHNSNADFSPCTEIISSILSSVLDFSGEHPLCLNVNIPKVQPGRIPKLKVCRAARGNWIEEFDGRNDPSGKPYYWLAGNFVNFEEGNSETDLYHFERGFATIVPIDYDLTDHAKLNDVKNLFP